MRPGLMGVMLVLLGAVGTAPLVPEPFVERPRAEAAPAFDRSPTTIRDLETITGATDGFALVGRRVELYAPVHGLVGEGIFWAGPAGNRMLVVVNGAETFDPALSAGSAAIVTGSVRRVADASDHARWGLSPVDEEELHMRPIYVRAETVRPVLPRP